MGVKLLLRNQPISLTDGDLIGIGGEAKVYRRGSEAVKIYHDIESSLSPTKRAARERLMRLRANKLLEFPTGLPAAVAGPTALVTDASTDAPRGFAMPLIEGAEPALRLASRRWREGVIDNATVVSFFDQLHTLIAALHKRDIVVGDLNDGNVLFRRGRPHLIDADSLQFDRYPCAVGHERFLDPRLYGVDLDQRPCFSAETDWYAFAVMLFSSLLYLHPYGGVHPTIPTLLRRAECSASVFRPDVKYPKAATHYQVLPDPLLDWLEGCFERGHRRPFPPALLEMQWTSCVCGCAHARHRCPSCSGVKAPSGPIIQVSGACRADRVFRTQGRILVASAQPRIAFAHAVDGSTRREDGSAVMDAPVELGMAFGLMGSTTWVHHTGQLVGVRAESVDHRLSTPAFAANSSDLFWVRDDWVESLATGRRLGQVIGSTTRLAVGESLGFGFYRAGHITVGFVFDPHGNGLRTLTLPLPVGRVRDWSASFDSGQVLFEAHMERGGKTHAVALVITADGRVVARLEGEPEANALLARPGGKVIAGARVLAPTDAGLLLARVDGASQSITVERVFTDTEPFVTDDSVLLPAPGGAVYVVSPQEITQLTLLP